MDEVEAYENEPTDTVGQSLRAAREAQGKSVEDIAAATRIPTRHLESLEVGDWERLPAPTYTLGFAKSYAGEVGLDRNEVGERLRAEMGGFRPVPISVSNEYFTPSDPKRTMPLGLVIGAIVAIGLVALGLSWLLNRDISGGDTAPPATVSAAPVSEAPSAPAPLANRTVLITATEAAWVDIRDGDTVLKQGEFAPGESFEVPPGATAPTISTAKPEALKISVGNAVAPTIGPAGKKIDKVSLKPDDLLRTPAADAAPTPTATTAPAARQAPSAPPRPRPSRQAAEPAPAPPEPVTINAAAQ